MGRRLVLCLMLWAGSALADERVAINEVRASDPVIEDFFSIVEDPRLTFVNLELESTREALGYLVSKSLVSAERSIEILAGVIK